VYIYFSIHLLFLGREDWCCGLEMSLRRVERKQEPFLRLDRETRVKPLTSGSTNADQEKLYSWAFRPLTPFFRIRPISYHLRPGGRVTGYLSRDLDLCRADCTYTRCPVEVVVPTNCNYATPGRQTYFVPLLTRNRIGGEHQRGEEVGVAVGCSHIITGRARGDAAITAECYQNKRRKEDEWDEIDTPYMCKAARKRRCMLRHLLEAQKC